MYEDYPKERVILYYPTISIRNPQWIKTALLYWDKIGIITPVKEYSSLRSESEEIGLDHYLKLYSEERIDILHNKDALADEFSYEYIDLIHSEKISSLYREKASARGYFDVNIMKFPDALLLYLIRWNYAHNVSEGWLRMSRLHGLLYMAQLAKYMADTDKGSLVTPGTDYLLYQDIFFKSLSPEGAIPGLAFSLEKILPVPRQDVTIKQLVKFRENHGNALLLLKFRTKLYEFQEKIKAATNEDQLDNVLSQKSEELTAEINLLIEGFNKEKISIVFGALQNILRVDAIPVLGTFALTQDVKITAGSAIISGAITLTKYLIDACNTHRQTLAGNSYSYLYQAYKRGIIERPKLSRD